MTGPATEPDRLRAPVPLLLAAVLVGAEGLGLLGLGVVGLLDVVPSRVEVGVSVALFFTAYGVALLACARALTRCLGWARGPVLLTQLIMVGIAWNARENPVVAVPLVLVAAVALVAMLRSESVEALQ